LRRISAGGSASGAARSGEDRLSWLVVGALEFGAIVSVFDFSVAWPFRRAQDLALPLAKRRDIIGHK
jgi:hypothetical protein